MTYRLHYVMFSYFFSRSVNFPLKTRSIHKWSWGQTWCWVDWVFVNKLLEADWVALFTEHLASFNPSIRWMRTPAPTRLFEPLDLSNTIVCSSHKTEKYDSVLWVRLKGDPKWWRSDWVCKEIPSVRRKRDELHKANALEVLAHKIFKLYKNGRDSQMCWW